MDNAKNIYFRCDDNAEVNYPPLKEQACEREFTSLPRT